MLIDPTQPQIVSPLVDYLLNHLQVVGWPTLVWIAVRMGIRVGRFFTLIETRILAHEGKVTHLVEEDVPAIKDSLDDVSSGLLNLHDVVVAARGSHL